MPAKLTPEQTRLKQFMLDNFDFDSLKQAGFYSKAIKRGDFEAQAARVCQWFKYKSVYEYELILIENVGAIDIARHTATVNEKGELEPAKIIGWLSITESEFDCPICTCRQEPKNTKGIYQTCKGCKRKIGVVIGPTGGIHVWDPKQ